MQAVIHYLLRETCAPYMAMLQEWIMKGVINDPYQEFLVMENRDVSKNDISTDFNDAYWYTDPLFSQSGSVASNVDLVVGVQGRAIHTSGCLLHPLVFAALGSEVGRSLPPLLCCLLLTDVWCRHDAGFCSRASI